MPGMNPVLIAYDGSDHARAAIERAGATLRHGPAVVATAWNSFEGHTSAALLALPGNIAHEAIADLDSANRDEAAELAAAGAELARAAGFEAESRALKATGPYFAALLDCAEEIDASAIVVGSRGRSRMAAAVLGSVSTGVINHTHRPVLIVRGE
jgi:nucleotide-binding universal stress UspA family protein